MIWPRFTPDERSAALLAAEYEKLQAAFVAFGRTPPSLEAVLDAAGRESVDPMQITLRMHAELRA